ncbi:MAG: winged helix-turn-helix transcriptional regulator [Crenarchaeota archaeon]|jgi:DNA-binding transcriptional ArsR family regulator|nr:winged helix-turn-helix transcriptional regulator [Thermoproteota archaeon]
MENEKQVDHDRQKAEVFDALGHPTRILILKVLSESSLGFADLKKKTAIESSGHLQHHLTKLNGLIKTDKYGKYCLSDEGEDALLTVQTVEHSSTESVNHKHRFNTKTALVTISLLLVGLLVVTSVIAVISLSQTDALIKRNSQTSSSFNPFGVLPDNPINAKLFDAPQIKLLSPDNRTYSVNSIPIVFDSVNPPPNSSATPTILIWVVYSLDGQANQTVTGDSPTGPMLTNLTNGSHTIILYVKDNHQLYGTSAPVTFTVDA